MVGHASRRSFVKSVAATALLAGGGPLQRSWAQTSPRSPLGNLPSVDGELLVDDAGRQIAVGDLGGRVRHMPAAVLRPKSVADVVRMVDYANKSGSKITMRGQGHSLYGQAQVDGGIVIDSSTLNAVHMQGRDALDAQPGALWGTVATAAVADGVTPPVMVDALMLSVGGTLSVGGIGETSYRDGCQVDQVTELDVVTGAGELMTCSAERNSELFHMTLAGLGQCGIIVRARLRLVRAPTHVVMRTLNYDDVAAFLADQALLAATEGLGPLTGRVIREPDGRGRFQLIAGSFVTETDEERFSPGWMAGLRHKSEAVPTKLSYWDFLNRRTASQMAGIAAVKRGATANPSLALMLPENATAEFVTHVLATAQAFNGIAIFEVFPMITARFSQPLQKMPGVPMSFGLRLHRRVPAANASDHQAMLTANQALLARMRAAGGKIYPPYAPIPSRAEWQEHYGAETWRRFAAAKTRFDPNNVLTPGAGIFQ
jgi:cytokinin dehydrogenase